MKRSMWMTTVLIFAVSFVLGLNAEGSEWIFYFTSPDSGDYYYRKDTLKYVSENTIRIEEKHSLNQSAVKKGIEYFGEQYRNVDHCLIMTELHCTMKKYRTLKHVDYSREGKIVHQISIPESSSWQYIPNETALQQLHRTICFH